MNQLHEYLTMTKYLSQAACSQPQKCHQNDMSIYKFVPKGPIDNNTALIQIMALRRIGDKPLSEPMLIGFTDTYMQH